MTDIEKQREWYDTGMGTSPDMWQYLSDELTDLDVKLPESLNRALYALRDGNAVVVPRDHP